MIARQKCLLCQLKPSVGGAGHWQIMRAGVTLF